jgi:putative peptide zinc metalloprotease protein
MVLTTPAPSAPGHVRPPARSGQPDRAGPGPTAPDPPAALDPPAAPADPPTALDPPAAPTGPPTALDPPAAPTDPPAATVVSRARGIELLGPLEGSGYRDPPHLVRRGDGQTVQLTPLLYLLLDAIDGRRDLSQLAAVLSERAGKRATPDQVRMLVEHKLRPAGLLREEDGTEPAVHKRRPLLALSFRYAVSDPQATRRLTDPFAWLFRPTVVTVVLAAFAAVSAWVLVDKGLASGTRHLVGDPVVLLVVFGLGLLSAGFHELGHAAACRYGGATPGVMGVALYLVWPAFYTDVTDSYRLGRRGRLRVDLGGLYFNAVFAVLAFAGWSITSWDALLLLIPLQLVHMLRQLLPFVRLDGYHILADLTGVPDLFARIGPTLASLVPGRSHAEARALRPWARAVVALWVLLVIPMLGSALVVSVLVLPRVAATVAETLSARWDQVMQAWAEGAVATPAVGLVSMAALALPLASTCYMLCRIAYRTWASVWRRTKGRPVRRAVAVAGAGVILGLVTVAWWPSDRYRPIEADDRGTIADVLPVGVYPRSDGGSGGAGTVGAGALMGPAPAPLPATVPLFGQELPVREAFPGVTLFGRTVVDPVYVVGDAVGASALTHPADEGTRKVVVPLPIDRPGVPLVPLPLEGRHDNEAVALNTTDGSTEYATSFTLVFVDGDVVDETNVADARASCTDCVTVAVAFQVVLVRGDDADTVIPENMAVALNVDCDNCRTYAIATQIVFTIPETLSPEATAELTELWSQAVALEQRIGDIPLEALYDEISRLEAAFVAFLASEAVQGPPGTAGTALAGSDDVASGSPPNSATTAGTADADAGPTGDAPGAPATATSPPPATTATTAPSATDTSGTSSTSSTSTPTTGSTTTTSATTSTTAPTSSTDTTTAP